MVRPLLSLVLAAALAPSLALADGKPLPADQHEPPVFLDETGSMITLGNHRDGYDIRVHLRLSGMTSKTDRIRVEWKQAGKLLATIKCDPNLDQIEQKIASGSCTYQDKLLTALGPVDADVIYSDDQTEKDYLVRTFHVTVKRWNEIGKERLWQIVPDDALAGGWARRYFRDELERPELLFWTERASGPFNASLRCTVEGKKLDDLDTDAETEEGAEDIDADHMQANGSKQHYHWNHIKLQFRNLFVGSKAQVKGGYDPAKMVFLADHPGKWDCKLRSEGIAIRELAFTVDDQGHIQQDEMNTGKGAIKTLPTVVMIDLRIPKDSKWDERIRPDAMKKSFGFGLAWPDHPKVKEVHASFPAASGLPD